MKDVSLFLLKKSFQKSLKLDYLSFICIWTRCYLLFLIVRLQNSVSLESELETRLVKDERVINEYEEKLSQISDTNSEEYQFAKENLDSQKKSFDSKDRNSDFIKRRALERSLLFAVARCREEL